MSAAPDPAEPSAPHDPAAYARRRMMGPGYWVFIAFGVLCVLAGYGLAKFGPSLFPAKPAPVAATPAGFTGDAALAPRALVPAPQSAAEPGPEPVAPATAELAALGERVKLVEAAQERTAQAAAAAMAAAALVEASQTSRPFGEELAALEAIAPPSPELAALRPLAAHGAPSRSALAAAFPDYAARAASASRDPGDGAGLLQRIGYALSRVVTLRRVGDVPGAGVDATLAKAERLIEDGDLDQGLRALDRLPPTGREALADWRTRAEHRAEIDRRVAAVRAGALAQMAKMARSGA